MYKNIRFINDPETVPELSSDRDPIMLVLGNHITTHTIRTIRWYKHTDWQQFRRTTDETLTIADTVDSPDELDLVVEQFSKVISDVRDQYSHRYQYRNGSPTKCHCRPAVRAQAGVPRLAALADRQYLSQSSRQVKD